MKLLNKYFVIITFSLFSSIVFGQIQIPDSEREAEEIGSTGWGVILQKVPNKNYYTFTSESSLLSKNPCKISFNASSSELDDLYHFLFSKFGSKTSSEIKLGNRAITVLDNENGLYLGEKGVCVFLIQEKISIKNLFGKSDSKDSPNYSLDFLDNNK